MPIYYKDAAAGSHWARTDPKLDNGLTSADPDQRHSVDRLVEHILNGPIGSPCISISASYGVAEFYARDGLIPGDTGFVYEIELDPTLPLGMKMLDPLHEIADRHKTKYPEKKPYHHDGDLRLMHRLIDNANDADLFVKVPPTTTNPGNVPVHAPRELRAIVNALRDAEILVHGTIPKDNIVNKHIVN